MWSTSIRWQGEWLKHEIKLWTWWRCWKVHVGGRKADLTAEKRDLLIGRKGRKSTITVDNCKRLKLRDRVFYSPVDNCKRLKVLKASTGKLQGQQSCDCVT